MEHGGDLVYLYQLIDGTCNWSHACHVALDVGLPAVMIKRAAQVGTGHMMRHMGVT